MTNITQVSFADDVQEEGAIALINPTTKQHAQLMALEAIATPAIIERRDALLEKAKAITTVSTDDELKTAGEVASKLKGLRNEVEKSRKLVKERALVIGRAIDGAAENTSAGTILALARLEKLQADYVTEKNRKAAAELKRQQDELREQQEKAARIIRESEEKAAAVEAARVKADKDAEAARLKAEREAAEAQAKASKDARDAQDKLESMQRELALSNDRTKAAELKAYEDQVKAAQANDARIKAETELAARLAEEKRENDELDAEIAAEEARQAAEAQLQSLPVLAPVSIVLEKIGVQGAAVAKDWDVQVIDIVALFKAKPECVTLTPNMSAIKQAIKTASVHAAGQPFQIAGLAFSPKLRVTNKAS